GIGDGIVARGAGPEVVAVRMQLADAADAHARAAHNDHVVHAQTVVAASRVGVPHHGGAVGVADDRRARVRVLAGFAQALGEVPQVRCAIARVAGTNRARNGIRSVIAEPDDAGGVTGTRDHPGLRAQVVHAVDGAADVA